MRTLFICLSIFCMSFIWKGEPPVNFLLCDAKPGEITVAHLKEIINSEKCTHVRVFDASGNEVIINEYILAITPKTGAAYFEKVTGSIITPSIKEKLTEVQAGTGLFFAFEKTGKGENSYKGSAQYTVTE